MTIRAPILKLIGVSVLVKILIVLATLFWFHSFVDVWGISVYYNTLVPPFAAHGYLPYLDYVWEYPVLMTVPVAVSAILSAGNRLAFLVVFDLLMILCDFISLVCVYYIALKIYRNQKRAFIAGFLFATAFSSAYFVFTSFEAMPVCLAMLALAFTIYGYESRGYFATVLGFFTKLFPVVILPFLFLHNLKTSSVAEQVRKILLVAVPLVLVLLVPFLLLNPANTLNTFTAQTEMQKDVFVSTFSYLVWSWMRVVGTSIPVSIVAMGATTFFAFGIIGLLWLFFRTEKKSNVSLLFFSCAALISLIAMSRFHSPQYMMWFTPLLCILVAGNLWQMAVVYLFEVIEYLKFPLLFYKVWTNNAVVNAPAALMLFTAEYLCLFTLMWMIWSNFRRIHELV